MYFVGEGKEEGECCGLLRVAVDRGIYLLQTSGIIYNIYKKGFLYGHFSTISNIAVVCIQYYKKSFYHTRFNFDKFLRVKRNCDFFKSNLFA
jgi:hypothetical protein